MKRDFDMAAALSGATHVQLDGGYFVSSHALRRLMSRGLSLDAIEAVLNFGRVSHTRGAEIHAVGWKEVERYQRKLIDLAPYAGLQVVCTRNGGVVLTAYRNHDFRNLRDGKHWIRRRPRSRR